jgi:uncharacterized protein (TIGR02145 family)
MAGNTFTDSRDGKVYKTVKIGNQVWMAENLAYLPRVVGPETGSGPYYDEDGYLHENNRDNNYYYVNDYYGTDVAAAKATINYGTYGVLYNWNAAMFACPPGWHLPNDEEWTQLATYLSNNGYNYDGSIGESGEDVYSIYCCKIAKSLASASGWLYSSVEGSPGNTDYPEYRNKSGFSALPGGIRDNNGWFISVVESGSWWSSTSETEKIYDDDDDDYYGNYYEIDSPYRAIVWNLDYDFSNVVQLNEYKTQGLSVRCVKD